ncbi:MAG: hypothetical protein R3F61_17055 [Myxococcota bacterium]
MRAWIPLVCLVPGLASAGPWEPGELRPVAVEGTILAVSAGSLGGQPSIALAGPGGIRVLGADGAERARATRDVADLVIEDLDTDGSPELVVCGPDGLNVLRVVDVPEGAEKGDAFGFGEPISLSTEPCRAVAALKGDLYASLVTLSGTKTRIWTPGGDGLVGADFAGPAKPRMLATTGGRLAVVGSAAEGAADAMITGPEPAPVALAEGSVSAIGPDGPGWAVAYGGEAPRLVMADGTEVPLPAEARTIERLALGGPNDLVVGLGGRSVALRVGDAALEVTELPVASDLLTAADLDGDGCADLVAVAADGSEGTVVTGVCDASPLAVPVGEEPPVSADADTLVVGERWAQLDVKAGVRAERRLVDGMNGWTHFASRGGPTGFSLTEDGGLSYKAVPTQVGLWRVAVLVSDGTQERWTGIVVKVVPGDAPAVAAVPEPEPEPEAVVAEVEAEPNAFREPGFFTIRECLVSAGVAGGLSKNGQSSWSNVGLPDAVPSASPAVALGCAGGGKKAGWFLGADSAPTFFYLSKAGRQNHVLAGTLGFEVRPGPVRIGPFVNAGLVLFGVGLRAAVLPFEKKTGGKHGFEMRVTGYPPYLSGQLMLAYTWEFGR